MKHLSSGMQQLCSNGYSQREISHMLHVGLATVNRDISYLRNQAKANTKRYIDERLPEEYERCLVGLNAITKEEAWNTAQNTEDKREKIQALSLAKECYSMKLDLLTNATVSMMLSGLYLRNPKRSHLLIAMKMIKNQENLIMMKMKIS
jgi:predicted transcriptional regulator